jgi:hypothetical protein
MCEDLEEQGVGPLLYQALNDRALLARQPAEVRERLARIAREEALVERSRCEEGRRAVSALFKAGVSPLIFKGSALAYTHYPEPWLRPRLDTDMLVRREDAAIARSVFESLGYTRAARPSGEHVTHQFTYVGWWNGIRVVFDVHWKLADPQVFANLFSYEELERESVPLPALGPSARTLSDLHSLVVACMHRIAHHYDRDTLIFLYDIDLLARQLDQAAWDRVLQLAGQKRIRAVTWRGVSLAAAWLNTPVPAHVGQALATTTDLEPTAAYLDPNLRKVDVLWSDLQHLDGWRPRVRLIREHLFPSPSFILQSSGRTSAVLLPSLYARRILRGVRRWFRPIR